MTKAWAIAARELRTRRQTLFAAGVLGGFPLLAPALPGADAAVRGAVAHALVVAATVLLALLLGARAVAPELAGGRFGFYWARPVRTRDVMAGKLLGAAATVAFAQALMLAPTALVDPRVLLAAGTPAAAALAAAAAFLFALGLSAALWLRLRSPLLALDAAGAGLLALGIAEAIRRWRFLFLVQAVDRTTLIWVFVAAATVLAAAWVAAATAAVERGRGDGARVHAVLSLLAWPAALVVAAALIVVPGRRLAVAPDATWWLPASAQRGAAGWIAFATCQGTPGKARRNLCQTVVAQPTSARLHVLPHDPRGWVTADVYLAAHAPRAVVVKVTGQRSALRYSLTALDLEPFSVQRTVALPVGADTGRFALAPDGRWAALASMAGTSLIDLRSGEIREAGRFGGGARLERFHFTTASTLRAYVRDGETLRIEELAVEGGRASVTAVGHLPWGEFDVSSDGSRVVVLRNDVVTLHDGRTGTLQATLPAPGSIVAAGALANGDVLAALRASDRIAIVRLAAPAPVLLADLGPAPVTEKVRFAALQPAGEVIVTLSQARRTIAVALAGGNRRELAPNLTPIRFGWRFPHQWGPVTAIVVDPLLGAFLRNDAAGRWVRRDGAAALPPVWH